jgi:hypothetical protein
LATGALAVGVASGADAVAGATLFSVFSTLLDAFAVAGMSAAKTEDAAKATAATVRMSLVILQLLGFGWISGLPDC